MKALYRIPTRKVSKRVARNRVPDILEKDLSLYRSHYGSCWAWRQMSNRLRAAKPIQLARKKSHFWRTHGNGRRESVIPWARANATPASTSVRRGGNGYHDQ